jgi:hypothetical protein
VSKKQPDIQNSRTDSGSKHPPQILSPDLLTRSQASREERGGRASRTRGRDQASEEHLVLIGHPPIAEFLSLATVQAVDARSADQRRLVNEWMNANDRITALVGWQPGFANGGVVIPIPTDQHRLVSEVQSDPIFQRSFSLMETTFGLVEIDRLIPLQKFVNLHQVSRLRRHLARSLTPKRIFRLCLPADHPHPQVDQTRVANNSWAFASRSNDLRFLDATLLGPDQIFGYVPQGPVAGVVALVVGFSSNFVNVIRVDNRMVLANGTHRAYALRQLGITHVPSIIQHVRRAEELGLVFGPQHLQQLPQLLQGVRPPVFADFFDPSMVKTLRLPPFNYQVRIRFEVEGPVGFPYCLST